MGSLGMFLGGWIFSLGILGIYIALEQIPYRIGELILPITLIALIGTVVESLPLKDYDNITVTTSALLMGYLLF
jgi:phytol kinase